ncbi:XdhC family protein, partial [Flavihumibacter sediminis]|nr:XdhC family protein [Flavihumibacter sediminis]
YEQAEQEGKKSALVTVVHLEGSSYRRPGARMLVTDEGEMTGAISGGCLEGDALRKALSVLNQQQSRLVTYDTSDEEDASIGVQLGCAGVIQVL